MPLLLEGNLLASAVFKLGSEHLISLTIHQVEQQLPNLTSFFV
jgi:hypothetical protein